MEVVTQTKPRFEIDRKPYALKAVLDVVGAIVLTVLLSPLLIALAIAIRLDSPGPAIYCQTRMGARGRKFTIYKFRTMKLGTPVLSTEEMQMRHINPYTRFGTLLRKTSLDELPQLFNIIKGEMSFIGPRPSLPSQTDVNDLRREMGADIMRPGITGLAQVMGRDNLDTQTKVHYDAVYCRSVSLSLDIKILIATLAAVTSARGNR